MDFLKDFVAKEPKQEEQVPPSVGSEDPPAQLAELGGGRYLGQSWSKKEGGYIAVICTPVSVLKVVDVDQKDWPGGDLAHGYAPTKRGVHYYFNLDAVLEAGWDAAYERLSQVRGFYCERLFETDGTPRSEPRGQYGIMPYALIAHRDAFLRAQVAALHAGIHTPQEKAGW